MNKRKTISEDPRLLKEWNYTKNDVLGFYPEKTTVYSEKKVWWLCKEGHEWETPPATRRKTNCPYCYGRYAIKGVNDLATLRPDITKDWNYEKNNGLKPSDVKTGSNTNVWWKCKNGHEWQSTVKARSKGSECPYCSGSKPIAGVNDLKTLKPEIAKEWNYERNDKLGININDVLMGSNKSVWWKCENGHEWKNVVYKRITFGSPCPICNGRRLITGINDLVTTNPELAKEWDYSKNVGIKPTEVTRISRKRVHWICSKCGKEWSIPVFSRAVDGSGCPACALSIRGEARHKSALKTNGHLIDKELLLDWDEEANYPLTPKDFTPMSNKYAYWKCHKCGYKWKAKVNNRVKGRGCPLCGNKIVVKGINDLVTTHPELAKQWHPTKNGDLKPDSVSYGCGKKIWWLCSKGHEFQATINHRSGLTGTKCPICNIGRQTSFAEQAVFYYVKQYYPDAINRYKPDFLERMELDIFIPSIKTAIEYDGAPWHGKDKLESEQKKYRLCHERNIKLIRIREQFSPLGSDIADYQFGNDLKLYEYDNLTNVITQLIQHLTFKLLFEIDVNVKRDEHKILQNLLKDEGESFEDKYPEIAKEWHPIKNGILLPSMFKPHTDHKAWWLCKDCGNEYYMRIGLRSYGSGCPKCSAKRVANSRKIKVEQIDIYTGETIKVYDSVSEAGKENHINDSNISTVCKGNTRRKQAGGYKWRYKEKN